MAVSGPAAGPVRADHRVGAHVRAFEEQLSIGAGQTLERSVVLRLAGISESVDVEANSGIDSLTSGLETRRGQDFMRSVPTRRNSMFARSTPCRASRPRRRRAARSTRCRCSVRPSTKTRFSSTGPISPVRARACRAPSRSWTSSRKCTCSPWARRSSSATSRAAVFNVVTKQGGARFAGETSYYASVLRPDRAADRAAGPERRPADERVRARQISRFHGAASAARQARSALVLQRVSVPPRLRQSAGRGPGASRERTNRTRSLESSRGGSRRRCR